MATITIKLDIDKKEQGCLFEVDENAERQIEKERQRSGKDRDAIILDIAQRTLSLMEFNAIREELAPYAEKANLSEEEILALPRMSSKNS